MLLVSPPINPNIGFLYVKYSTNLDGKNKFSLPGASINNKASAIL